MRKLLLSFVICTTIIVLSACDEGPKHSQALADKKYEAISAELIFNRVNNIVLGVNFATIDTLPSRLLSRSEISAHFGEMAHDIEVSEVIFDEDGSFFALNTTHVSGISIHIGGGMIRDAARRNLDIASVGGISTTSYLVPQGNNLYRLMTSFFTGGHVHFVSITTRDLEVGKARMNEVVRYLIFNTIELNLTQGVAYEIS